MLRALAFQNGRFRHQKPQGKLRERQLIRRKANVIYCDKIGVPTALFQYLLRALDFQNGRFGNQNPQGKLRERKLLPPKESVIK